MTPAELTALVHRKRSVLCVGLDPNPDQLPEGLPPTPAGIVEFCGRIIQATERYAVAYKINTAFFEALGVAGWEALADVASLLPAQTLRIADAKRGDIGNTASRYAEAFLVQLPFDAITVAPYMGHDSVMPFLAWPDKWVFLLALTSNPGADDFQLRELSGLSLYENVIVQSRRWTAERPGQLGYVAGATQVHRLGEIRKLAPESWLLVPGVGTQGGDLTEVMRAAATPQGGLLVNASRSILYASRGADYAEAAAAEAARMQAVMADLLP